MPAISSPTAQAQGSGPLYTTLVAQNMNSFNTMNARVIYYTLSGSPVLTTTHTVQPYRALTINQPSQPGLPTSFSGSAAIDSDLPFGAFVYQYNGIAGTLGKNLRVDGYNASSSIAAATELVFPQLLKNIYDAGTNVTYNSSLSIQNTSAATASVTIKYKQSSGEEYVRSGITIPAGGFFTADLPSDSALSTVPNFYGTARLTSTQPVAVVAHHSAAGILMSYAGFSSANAGTTLYLPQLLKTVYDPGSAFYWNTGVVLMSFDGTPANVTITYTSVTGNVYTESQTAAPMGGFDLRYSSALAGLSSFYGTGKLTADKPIVAAINTMTNYDANRGLRAAVHRAFPSTAGATRVFLPTLRKNANDAATGISWSTSVVGRLVGDSATTVTLTYYLNDGTSIQQTHSVTPSAPMFNLDQRYAASVPDGSTFSGVLTTSPAQPIVAAAAFSAGSSVLGDACLYYEGIGH